MGKSIQKVMTRGAEQLGLPRIMTERLFQKAESLLKSSPFLVFDPKNGTIVVEDGNGKKLDTLSGVLPRKVWIIFDDYGDRWVATLLLPEEY